MASNFDIKRENIETLINVYKMRIPDFQRKYVWKDSKKKDLIDSLIRNYPIGALTLYNDIEEKAYLLVDGLQRYNTINLYLNNPSSILNFNEYYLAVNSNSEISNFCKDKELNETTLKKYIKKWYESLNTSKENGNKYFAFENMKLLLDILKEFNDKFLDIENFQWIRERLLNVIDIRNKLIALIIYEGSKDDLPDLFTKINKKNVSLTPYEILHSMWYNYTIPKYYNGIDYEKYFILSLEKNNFENDARAIDNFNVYMYLVALGFKCNPNKDVESNRFIDKNIINRFGSEIIFDAFSTITCGQSNKIASVIEKICSDASEKEYSSEILEIGEDLSKCIILLNDFIADNKITFITSKYFYLYLVYILYKFKDSNNSIPFTITFIDSINKASWFKDKFRQVSFFDSRISDIEKYINDTSLKFNYNDENNLIEYTFNFDNGKFYDLLLDRLFE